MTNDLDHTNLHRTAKLFMDTGRAESHEAAVDLLKTFGLAIHLGSEVAHSIHHQIALLTLVNVARRTFLGGIEVVGPCDGQSLSVLAPNRSLTDAVQELGGRIVDHSRPNWPVAVIGGVNQTPMAPASWQLTWQGWSGGVIPCREERRLNEGTAISIAPALAAAICAAEAFAYHSGDHSFAGRRAAGVSLWNPAQDWQSVDPDEPSLSYLPSRLWLIGMGNLGQAFAWLLTCLPYHNRRDTEYLLQDFDRIAPSNDSTSLLSFFGDVGRRKARCVADWLEGRGFTTTLEERRFGEHTRRSPNEPGVALCGVDNAVSRMALEKVGFDLVVEAGLGAGPNAFRSISLHTFPGSQSAEQIWSRHLGGKDANYENNPAYQALKAKGMDSCGLTQLASRTVGVPFVGLVAAALGIAELLRRLHGGTNLELVSGSLAAPEDFEVVPLSPRIYPGAFNTAALFDVDTPHS